MAAFDPVSAIAGGLLIGLAATLLLLLNGRIAGVSGVFGDLLAHGAERGWRAAFLIGLIASPAVLALAGHSIPLPDMPASWIVIAAGGLLVGLGTHLAGGCTSGHGVCGIARLSPRSFIATATFMATAIVVVAVVRHGIGA